MSTSTFKHRDIVRRKDNHAKVGMVVGKWDDKFVIPGYVYVIWFPFANRAKLVKEDELEKQGGSQ